MHHLLLTLEAVGAVSAAEPGSFIIPLLDLAGDIYPSAEAPLIQEAVLPPSAGECSNYITDVRGARAVELFLFKITHSEPRIQILVKTITVCVLGSELPLQTNFVFPNVAWSISRLYFHPRSSGIFVKSSMVNCLTR